MNVQNLNIGTQLKLGFAVLLFFVSVLGVVSYNQNGKLHQQTVTMYEHPLTVRRAIDLLGDDILLMRIHMSSLPLAKSDQEISELIEKVDIIDADATKQAGILYDRYLGSRIDVDAVSTALMQDKANRTETIRLFRAGKHQDVINRLKSNGVDGVQLEKTLAYIKVLDTFALKKGESIFASKFQEIV